MTIAAPTLSPQPDLAGARLLSQRPVSASEKLHCGTIAGSNVRSGPNLHAAAAFASSSASVGDGLWVWIFLPSLNVRFHRRPPNRDDLLQHLLRHPEQLQVAVPYLYPSAPLGPSDEFCYAVGLCSRKHQLQAEIGFPLRVSRFPPGVHEVSTSARWICGAVRCVCTALLRLGVSFAYFPWNCGIRFSMSAATASP